MTQQIRVEKTADKPPTPSRCRQELSDAGQKDRAARIEKLKDDYETGARALARVRSAVALIESGRSWGTASAHVGWSPKTLARAAARFNIALPAEKTRAKRTKSNQRRTTRTQVEEHEIDAAQIEAVSDSERRAG